MNKTWVCILCLCILFGGLSLSTSCNDQTYLQGSRLYTFHCAQCHMEDGSGLQNVIPSIQQSEYFDSMIDSLPCLMRHGKANYVTADSAIISMPVNYKLTEYEINNIINHILSAWHPDRPSLSIKHTQDALNECPVPMLRYGQ